MFDGYDAGVLYADQHIAKVIALLKEQGIFDDTAILISGDHGEALGELNIYGDHQTADETTCHVPAILKWPGVTDDRAGRVDTGLHYQFDIAATAIEFSAASVPPTGMHRALPPQLRARNPDAGREALVLSQAAWTCQRALRFRQRRARLAVHPQLPRWPSRVPREHAL